MSSKLKFLKEALKKQGILKKCLFWKWLIIFSVYYLTITAKRQSNYVKNHLTLLLQSTYTKFTDSIIEYLRKRILFVRKSYVIWFDRDSLFVGINRKLLFLQENYEENRKNWVVFTLLLCNHKSNIQGHRTRFETFQTKSFHELMTL